MTLNCKEHLQHAGCNSEPTKSKPATSRLEAQEHGSIENPAGAIEILFCEPKEKAERPPHPARQPSFVCVGIGGGLANLSM